MSESFTSIIHKLVKRLTDMVSESENEIIQLEIINYKLVKFVKSCKNHTCCLCNSECCIVCNAKTVLEEIGEK